jgi:hypothetical protein
MPAALNVCLLVIMIAGCMKRKDELLAAQMKILDRIIMWLVTHEEASKADIADYLMVLKRMVQDDYTRSPKAN